MNFKVHIICLFGRAAAKQYTYLFCWAIHIPAIPHQCPSTWHREDHTPAIWRLTQWTRLAPDMKADWSSLQHTYRMEALTQVLSSQETIWKPVAHGLMVSFDRQAGPTFGCALSVWTEPDNWVRVQWKAGLDNTVSTTPDVVTGSHELLKFDTVVATFRVYH